MPEQRNTTTPTLHAIEGMLELARRGKADYRAELLAFLASFEHIVLRGAGKFGSAFGAFLLDAGIPAGKLCYWDQRAGELQQVNGITVNPPFAAGLTPTRAVIVNCIPNGSLSGSASRNELHAHGYANQLSGMALFEALMCELGSGEAFDRSVCIRTTFCNWCSCKRLPSLLLDSCRPAPTTPQEELVLPVATFVLGQKCTLKCSHCGQFINHYPAEDRINFPVDRILKDIDAMFAAVDAIGYVSVIGGEPFLHPELQRIVAHIMTKANYGVLGITTNGVCDISDDMLAWLRDKPVRLIFSDYTAALSDKQRKLFAGNLERVRAAGVSHTIGQPLWSLPASLKKFDLPEQERHDMKANCNSTITCKTIQNGVYYPCSTTAGVGSHHLADYPDDWVALDDAVSPADLKARLLAVDKRPSYASCAHCLEGGKMLPLAGEQGVSERYIHFERYRAKSRQAAEA